jgi:hypothetical protein
MSIRRAVSFALVTTALLTTMVRAQPQAPNGRGACFFSRDFQQWKSSDPNTILIRVGLNRFYRLDLSSPCRTLQFPSAHLVTVFRGSDIVCSPLDWDLRVSQNPAGITEQCVVRSMTQLTPEQVASIPPRLRP